MSRLPHPTRRSRRAPAVHGAWRWRAVFTVTLIFTAVPRRCQGGAKAVPLPRNPGRTAHADGRSTNTAENRRVGRGAMKDQRQQPNGGKLLAGLSQHFLSQASLRSGWCCASRSGVGAHEARES